MTSEGWARAKELLCAAMELESSERRPFLDRQCQGDPEMRSELDALIAEAEVVGSFMQTPPLGSRNESPPPETSETREIPAQAPQVLTSWLLKDRYKILKELSRGGFGAVFLAIDKTLHDRQVVIKIPIPTDSGHSDWKADKFMQEIRALSIIDHPGVVGVFDAGVTPDGAPFFVMQFVEGKSLRKFVCEGGAPLDEFATIVTQIGNALHAAHQKGVWHRDLKPDNIMVQTTPGGDRIVKLIDFGIATISQRATTETPTLVAGTPAYMSPEQLEGRVSQSCDIYSFGVIAFELLTGKRPAIARQSPEAKAARVRPSQLRPEIPAEADELLLQALAPLPEDRPADAGRFGKELAQAVYPSPKPATPIPPPPAGPRHPHRRNIVWGSLVASALALAGMSTWILRHQPTPAVTLSYSIIVQPAHDGRPGLAQLRSPFKTTDAFSFLVRASQAGHLYLLIDDASGLTNVFPSPHMYQGFSSIAPGEQKLIPEKSSLRFDPTPSRQDVWLIWSRDPVAPLENLRKWMNPQDQGAIREDAPRIRALVQELSGKTRLLGTDGTSESVSSVEARLAWKILVQAQ
jgi:serine/threonine protein kinase